MVLLAAVVVIMRLLDDERVRGILFGSAIILVLATCVPPIWSLFSRRDGKVLDLRLQLPSDLAEQIRGLDRKKVFANPTALGQLLLLIPNAGEGLSPAEAARLSTNPSQWREGFRREGWDTVLLSGPVGEYRPLLDHLVVSPDWHLAAVTNYGYLFRYGSGLPPRTLDPAFRLGSDQETASYLAQIAGYYDAIRRTADARTCLERALELAPENTIVLSHAATFAIAQKRWQHAIDYSSKALAIDHDLGHAKLVQALALLEIGEAQKAENLVDEVLLVSPDDAYTLFLSARIRRSLNDYGGEAEALERLIVVARKSGGSPANYQIYLGQAYARQGLSEPALRNYRAALVSGQLDRQQTEEVRKAIEAVESKRAP